jgi:hypothetical protein
MFNYNNRQIDLLLSSGRNKVSHKFLAKKLTEGILRFIEHSGRIITSFEIVEYKEPEVTVVINDVYQMELDITDFPEDICSEMLGNMFFSDYYGAWLPEDIPKVEVDDYGWGV